MEIEAGYASELGLAGDLRYVARTVQPLIKMDGHYGGLLDTTAGVEEDAQ